MFSFGKLYFFCSLGQALFEFANKKLLFLFFPGNFIFQASQAVRSDFRASHCHRSEFKVANLGVTIKRQSMAKSSEDGKRKGNRLLKEKSPYLLQHAYNPVDW